jgi:hypothetical protein
VDGLLLLLEDWEDFFIREICVRMEKIRTFAA